MEGVEGTCTTAVPSDWGGGGWGGGGYISFQSRMTTEMLLGEFIVYLIHKCMTEHSRITKCLKPYASMEVH